MKFLTRTKPWSELIRPVAVAGLTAGLGVTVASTAIAQDTATPAARIDVTNSPVALHDGSCDDPVLEPEFEVGALELEARYGSSFALAQDFEEIGEGDLDADGVVDEDEPGYLEEDLDGDGILDEGEDLNGNGVLDVGIDEDGDGVLDNEEILVAMPEQVTTVWEVDAEVDATFEDLFGTDDADEEDDDVLNNPGIIALHESSDNYGNILACAELDAPAGWEDRDTVVLGITPVGDSDLYGYAVFERDTGNIPVFGENTTGITVYIIDNLPTLRDTRMTEGTPES